MTKNFFNFRSFFHIIVFMKSVATSSKIRTVISFHAKALKRFPEKNLRGYCGLAFIAQITFSRNFENNWNKNVNFRQLLKIILINENPLLEMYPNEINFLPIDSWRLNASLLNTWKQLRKQLSTKIDFCKVSRQTLSIFSSRRSVAKSEFCNDMLRIISNQYHSLREKCPNMEFFLVRIFLHLDWIRRDTEYLSVLSPNTGKYGPEKTPYLDAFHAVRS